MTLIAAFRCKEGVVLCADQQETVGGVRVAVNKITPQDCGNYQLAFAGSGNGDLIDGFADSLRLDVAQWRPQLDGNVIRGNIRNLLLDFYANELSLYPADTKDDKLNHCIVCVKPKESADIFLWELRGSVIVPVVDYSLLGIGEAIYRHELKRLYFPSLQGMQAVLLGIHLFSLAKETSNYVGGQTDLIFVNEKGMWPEDPRTLDFIEQAVARFNKMIAELVLACPNTAGYDSELEDLLTKFHSGVMEMREGLFKHTVYAAAHRSLFPNWTGEAYQKFPPGSLETCKGGWSVRHIKSPTDSVRPIFKREKEKPPSDSETSEGQQ